MERLTHPQRKLRYGTSNWSNHVIDPIILSYQPNLWVHILKMLQLKNSERRQNMGKRAHVTPLFVSLHWLPVAARIQLTTLMIPPSGGAAEFRRL